MSTTISTFISNLKDLENLADQYTGTKPHPEYYNTKQLTLDFIRREVYNSLKWSFATGSTPDSGFISYVKSKNKNLATFFGGSKSAANDLKDSNGNKINGIHLCATLSTILFGSLPSEWFGWGGDIATGARNIHDQRAAAGVYISAKEMAEKIIGNENYNCSFSDIVTDIDAVLIRSLNSGSYKLSYTFNDYYKNTYGTRFKKIVDFYGGKSKFEKKVTDVLSSSTLRKNLAKGATEEEIQAACKQFINIVYKNM